MKNADSWRPPQDLGKVWESKPHFKQSLQVILTLVNMGTAGLQLGDSWIVLDPVVGSLRVRGKS